MSLTTISVLFFGAVLAVITFFYIKYSSKEFEVPEDATMFEHNILPSKYTNNYSEGFVVRQIKGPKRTLFIFKPKDINYVGNYNEKYSGKIENQKIYVRNDLIFTTPKGSKSDRSKILALPCRSDSLPDELPNTIKQKYAEIIEGKNSELHLSDVLKERLKRTENLNIEDSGGIPSIKFIKNFKANANDYYKSLTSKNNNDQRPSILDNRSTTGM